MPNAQNSSFLNPCLYQPCVSSRAQPCLKLVRASTQLVRDLVLYQTEFFHTHIRYELISEGMKRTTAGIK